MFRNRKICLRTPGLCHFELDDPSQGSVWKILRCPLHSSSNREITVAMLKTSKFKWYFQVCWFLMFFFYHVLQILVDACAWEVAVHCCKFCIWPSRKTCSLVGCELSLVCFWLFFADEQGDVVAVLQPTSATELNSAFSIVGIGRACVVPGFFVCHPIPLQLLAQKSSKD